MPHYDMLLSVYQITPHHLGQTRVHIDRPTVEEARRHAVNSVRSAGLWVWRFDDITKKEKVR